jgi:hypothetical protein
MSYSYSHAESMTSTMLSRFTSIDSSTDACLVGELWWENRDLDVFCVRVVTMPSTVLTLLGYLLVNNALIAFKYERMFFRTSWSSI